jgi:hypothetical protein
MSNKLQSLNGNVRIMYQTPKPDGSGTVRCFEPLYFNGILIPVAEKDGSFSIIYRKWLANPTHPALKGVSTTQ